MANKTSKPTAKRVKGKATRSATSRRIIEQLPSRVWFELELDSEIVSCEHGVSVRFDYESDEPTICMDYGQSFSVSNILEIAEVVKVLPKLKIVSMC